MPSEQAEAVRIAYNLYQHNNVSLSDIINYYREHNISCRLPSKNNVKRNLDRSQVSQILRNPLYVKADKDVYQYFLSLGYEMIDDIDAYDSVHGLFWHTNPDGSKFIKVAYHEGLVDSATWLAVQDKKSHNKRIPRNGSASNSWLTGLTKCAHCGYSLAISYAWNANHTIQWRCYHCKGFHRVNGCVKFRLQTRPNNVEEVVFKAMKERIEQLVITKKESTKSDSKTESIKADIIRLDEEIGKLMDKLANADDILFDYINKRIKELHAKKAALEESLRNQTRKHKQIDTSPLTEPLKNWDNLTVHEKHEVATTMIDVVYVSDETGIEIKFSI